jgi:hypothetical protein
MFTKEWLYNTLKSEAGLFLKNNESKTKHSEEWMMMLEIANQLKNNMGLGIDYPILKPKKDITKSFFELINFYVITEESMHNANGKTVRRLKITFLLDIDIDTRNMKPEWVMDDEFIFIYIES